jgi:hypothetical protein
MIQVRMSDKHMTNFEQVIERQVLYPGTGIQQHRFVNTKTGGFESGPYAPATTQYLDLHSVLARTGIPVRSRVTSVSLTFYQGKE